MHLIVNRGTQEIGSSYVGLPVTSARMLLDLGMPPVNRDSVEFDWK
jgi:hypothetical protein